MMAHTKQNTL